MDFANNAYMAYLSQKPVHKRNRTHRLPSININSKLLKSTETAEIRKDAEELPLNVVTEVMKTEFGSKYNIKI